MFLTSGSIVQKSFCLMLVTAVGKDTQWGGHRSSTESDMSHENTFLTQFRTSQDLLEKLMLYIMFLFLLILSLDFIVLRSVYLEETYGIAEVIYKLVYKFYDSLTFILTLVPSSLFSSFSLALLYFIPRMSADGALIMKLETCSRKLGSITTICTGKAGLLTYAEMEVKNSWVASDLQEGEDRTTQSLSAMPEDVQDLLLEGLVLNSGSRSASLEESCCCRTERALLRWGQALLGWDHQDSMGFETIRQRYTLLKLEPFDSERKRSGAFLRRESDGNCVVHWKGAPSTILSSCRRWIYADGKSGRTTIRTLSDHDRIIIEAKIANMENTGLRCVAFAYCELGRAAPYSIGQAASGGMQLGNCSLAHISSQEVDLTLLAMVGMKETCRLEASKDVTKARNAGLRVIMVTGDSIEAARVIAKECGIIEESINIEEQVVDGSTFREWTLSNRQERLQRLTVLARASDHDKQLLVASLQANDEEVVAVTGDKHTDVDVLQKADVAFSLGRRGKQVAIESLDIILLDDSFTSILKAIEWGRCMRCNLQYFLHFQITMSVVTPLISQLSGTQFQWIDLITMLASIAVIMQPPLPSLMLQPRPLIFPKHLYTNIMFRNFILQAMYQVILFSVIINYTDVELNRTIVFNSFIFCQVINIVTARQLHIFQSLRRLYSHMDNSHEGLLKVKIFLRWCGTNIIQKNLLLMALITIIAIMQVVIIQFAGHTFSSTRLKWNQWLFCVGFALGSWVVGVFGERLPMPNTPRLMDFVC